MRKSFAILYFFIIYAFAFKLEIDSLPADDLKLSLQNLQKQRQLKGIQIQITKSKEVIFNLNLGQKNQNNDPIDNNTIFRIASVSKSFASVAIMQLVEKGKLRLNQSLSQIFGYKIVNPNFPNIQITLQMILSHQSSLVECDPYYSNFLDATYNAKTGSEVPDIKQILLKGGKFYNNCLYSATHQPGKYFHYVNLNFGIAGTIVQIVAGQRYDLYQRDNILAHISQGLEQIATFNPYFIKNPLNLGVLYNGVQGKWVPNYDYYPSGNIPERNLTGYKIGSNGVIYGPQGSLRASVSHLTNYAILLANNGKTKSGKTVLTVNSVSQLLKPRYQFHGTSGGVLNDFHLYGLGLFTTTYHKNDIVINHEVVRGHLGAAYNLISAQHFWKDYTLTYIINGALNGYKYGTGTIYQYERLAIHSAVQKYVNSIAID